MYCRTLTIVLVATVLGAAERPTWVGAQHADGYWPAEAGETAVSTTCIALLCLADLGDEGDSASRALTWLDHQLTASTPDTRAHALGLFAASRWSSAPHDNATARRLAQRCEAVLVERQVDHPRAKLPLGWSRQTSEAAIDTQTTVIAILALTTYPLTPQRRQLLAGADNWLTLAWATANQQSLSYTAAAWGSFPPALIIDDGVATLPLGNDGAESWGLVASLLLQHPNEDLIRTSLKHVVAHQHMIGWQAKLSDLERWATSLAWRGHFQGEAADQALASHRQWLSEQKKIDNPILRQWLSQATAEQRSFFTIRLDGDEVAPAPGSVERPVIELEEDVKEKGKDAVEDKMKQLLMRDIDIPLNADDIELIIKPAPAE